MKCGIMHGRCCRPAASSVHYTTSESWYIPCRCCESNQIPQLFSPLPGLDLNEVACKLSLYHYELLCRRHWRSNMHRQAENAKKGNSVFFPTKIVVVPFFSTVHYFHAPLKFLVVSCFYAACGLSYCACINYNHRQCHGIALTVVVQWMVSCFLPGWFWISARWSAILSFFF